jgi:hypothetical protein
MAPARKRSNTALTESSPLENPMRPRGCRRRRYFEMKFLGAVPVKDEPMACFAATEHKFTVEAGDEYAQGTIIATMLLKD